MKNLILLLTTLMFLPYSLISDPNKNNHIQLGPSIGWSFMGINTKKVPTGYENWPKFTNNTNISLSSIIPLFPSQGISIIANFGKIIFPYGLKYDIVNLEHNEMQYFVNYTKYGLAVTYKNFIFGVDYATIKDLRTTSIRGNNYDYNKDSLQSNIILNLGGILEFWKSSYGSCYFNAGIYYCLNNVFKENAFMGPESFNTKPISFYIMISYMFNIYKIE